MIRKILVCLLISCPQFAYSQNGYQMLRGHPFAVTEVNACDEMEFKKISQLLSVLKYYDQQVRSDPNSFVLKYARFIDSLNYLAYEKYFKGKYISFLTDQFKAYLKGNTGLLMDNWVLQLHFSDRFGLPLINLIANSIPSKSCNQFDLMNYSVHYLWRSTEFSNQRFYDQPVHVILLPELSSHQYGSYLKYALNKYLAYCFEKNKKFKYVNFDGLIIINGLPVWKELNKYINILPVEGILKFVKQFEEYINIQIKDRNAFPIKDNMYSLVVCNHPNNENNPPYIF